jgi:membrane-bound ClpP family serine protease
MNLIQIISRIIIPQSAMAQGTEWSGTCVSGDVATIQGFECLFANLLKVIMGFAGLTFFIVLIIGGFKFLTSGGDPKKMASASSTLTLAFISLLGVIISWLILLFIQNFTGINVTQFSLSS